MHRRAALANASVAPGAPWLWKWLVALFRLVAHLLGLRLELWGAEFLPRSTDGRPVGSWIAAVVPHRTWIDPFVLAVLLPREPRPAFLGDARAIFRSPLRRIAFRLLGGVVPIQRGGGGAAFEEHVAAAVRVVEAGAVLVVFPEVGPPVPPGIARPLSPGCAYFALRSGAPIVPLVLGGNDELYRGRRIQLRVLGARTVRDLGGLDPAASLPAPGSLGERALAHRIGAELRRLTEADVAAAQAACAPPSGAPRRWRWLTHLFH